MQASLAWLPLASSTKTIKITLFESAPEAGGHTATKDVILKGQRYAIDTGFIVFNNRTYPNFIALLEELEVSYQETEMSFSVSCLSSGLEYAGHNLNSLFAQRKNLLSPYFLKLLSDILRFNREAVKDLDSGKLDNSTTLDEYLNQNHYGKGFRHHYLIPMAAAIWSAGSKTIETFPLRFFVQFFKNHGLLSISQRPQWYTLIGGSRSYLEPLIKPFKDHLKLSTEVTAITRNSNGVVIDYLQQGEQRQQFFDQVIFACHSDQVLRLLTDPSLKEQNILSAIPYQASQVTLHTDHSLLPTQRRAWSSWNYQITGQQQTQPVLSYHMNTLQCLQAPVEFCVTLNADQQIKPETVLGQYQYSHPQFSLDSIKAQQRWAEINGINHSWFCGAYWGNGFHEDGVVSALRVVDSIQQQLHQPQLEWA